MINSYKKLIIASTLVSGVALSSVANAGGLTFTIDENDAANVTGLPILTADEMFGGYNEVVKVTPTGAFEATVLLDFTSFRLANDTQDSALNPGVLTAPGIGYGLYAIVDFEGNALAGAPNFETGNWTGTLQMWLDSGDDSDSGLEASLVDINTFGSTIAGNGNDELLFSGGIDFGQSNGTVSSASFSLDATLDEIPSAVVGQPASTLTDAGKAFFKSPNPFYSMLFSFGGLDNFFDPISGIDFSGTNTDIQRFSSEANVQFVTSPSSIAILGLGLFALAYRARTKK